MAVYRPLKDIDVLQTVLTAGARVTVTSGTGGWKGGPAGTGSVGVYDGFRSSGYTGAVTAQPRVFPGVNDLTYRLASGSYPLTASMRWAEVKLVDRAEGRTTWGNRSWAPVERLYDFYSRYNPEYDWESYYDYHCTFFEGAASNLVMTDNDGYTGRQWTQITGALTVEAWIKPFNTGTITPQTIAARKNLYRVFLSGGLGKVYVSSSFGIQSSSLNVSNGRWSHVGFTFYNGTGSIYVNMGDGTTFTHSGRTLARGVSGYVPNFTVGGLFNGTTFVDTDTFEDAVNATATQMFHGAIHEVREWGVTKTWSEMSASHNVRLVGTEDGLKNYLPMRAGHRSGSVLGSASLNGAAAHTHSIVYSGWGGDVPVLHPCDNPYFYPDKTLIVSSSDYTQRYLRVLSIPSLFYGRQIATGTFEMVERQWEFAGSGLHRVIRDDGRGGLYMRLLPSGTHETQLDAPVTWNRVGNIFYSEGIAVLNHDCAIHFADGDQYVYLNDTTKVLSVSFRGVNRVPTKMISCRVGPAEANASNNQTFAVYTSGSDKYELVDDTRTTWVTAVGLYDEQYRLVGVAKLAAPLRKRERDRFNIRLKLDL